MANIFVKATAPGHYGRKLREPGEVFSIADEEAFSSVWMEKVERPKTQGKPAPKT